MMRTAGSRSSLVALLGVLAGVDPARATTEGPSSITKVVRESVESQIPTSKVESLECLEPSAAEAFRCQGRLIDGTPFLVRAERTSEDRIVVRTIHLNPPEMVLRPAVAPFVAGRIAAFECPIETSGSFECRGTLEDGGAFTVSAVTEQDAVNVRSIRHHADSPSALFRAVQSYLPGTSITAVECLQQGASTPDAFECRALHADGKTTLVQVGVQPDGSARVHGIVVHLSKGESRAFRMGGIALLVGGIFLLVLSLVKMDHLRQRSIVARLTLAPKQPVAFPSADTYVLYGEANRFSMVFGGLRYSLVHTASGEDVQSFPAILRARTSGFVRVRMALRRFFVQRSGDHILTVDGLAPGGEPTSAMVLFSRAWGPREMVWVALAVASVFMLAAGLFLFLAG